MIGAHFELSTTTPFIPSLEMAAPPHRPLRLGGGLRLIPPSSEIPHLAATGDLYGVQRAVASWPGVEIPTLLRVLADTLRGIGLEESLVQEDMAMMRAHYWGAHREGAEMWHDFVTLLRTRLMFVTLVNSW